MFTDFLARSSHRHRLLLGGVVATAGLLVAGLFVLAGSSPSHHSSAHSAIPTQQPPVTLSVPSAPSGTSAPNPPLPKLTRTDDPDLYAREVATALFGVNPALVSRAEFLRFWRGELPTVVYSDAASRGLSLAAQNTDVIDNLTSSWIPSQGAWTSEAADRTTTRFTVTAVSVPDYWVNAIANGTFRDPGLHMERVMGVLNQSYGTNPTDRQVNSRSAVIDLGLLCGPTQPGGCRLVAPQPPPELGSS